MAVIYVAVWLIKCSDQSQSTNQSRKIEEENTLKEKIKKCKKVVELETFSV